MHDLKCKRRRWKEKRREERKEEERKGDKKGNRGMTGEVWM